jgi:predicted oxidoreductase (fatty acid repression mutant protein)
MDELVNRKKFWTVYNKWVRDIMPADNMKCSDCLDLYSAGFAVLMSDEQEELIDGLSEEEIQKYLDELGDRGDDIQDQ